MSEPGNTTQTRIPPWLAAFILAAALLLGGYGVYLVYSGPSGEQWFVEKPPAPTVPAESTANNNP